MGLNEDVLPIENGDILASYVSLPEGMIVLDAQLFLDMFFLIYEGTLLFQGTIGCTRNVRVPMVFIVFSRDSWG